MDEYEYPTLDDVIRVNQDLFGLDAPNPFRRAEKHQLEAPSQIILALKLMREESRSGWYKAAVLLKALCKRPFASGNKRTAFLMAYAFLIQNGLYQESTANPVIDEPDRNTSVLVGTRQGYYTVDDLAEWYETG